MVCYQKLPSSISEKEPILIKFIIPANQKEKKKKKKEIENMYQKKKKE